MTSSSFGQERACSGKTLNINSHHLELQRAADRLFHGVVRGACIGLTLRGGLHLVGSILASASKKKRARSVTLAGALEDTLRFTAFLGTLAGLYIGVDEGISAVVGKGRSAKWRSLVAGVCAGPALLLTGPQNRHYSLATYILLRGITLLIRVGNKPHNQARHPWVHTTLAPTRLSHGDTVLMCASCSQIIYAFIMHPHTLPASYVRFIRKQGAKELYVWQGIRELAERTAVGKPVGPLTSLIGTCYADSKAALPCPFFHPNKTCWQHPMQLFLPSYQRALSVYLPVYVLPALLVHRQQLLKQPLPILQKVLLGIARSSLFLSTFICVAFAGACAGHNLFGYSTGAIIAGSTWIGGLATLLEKKSRRMELALYVTSRSLESFSRCCAEWGWVSPRHLPPRLDMLLFAAGVGAITHCYSGANGVHRDVFRSKYLNVLDFVFGNMGISEGRIKHDPSNHDLLKVVSTRVREFSYTNLQGLHVRSVSYNSLETFAPRTRPVRPGTTSSALAGVVCVEEQTASATVTASKSHSDAVVTAVAAAAGTTGVVGTSGSNLHHAANGCACLGGQTGSSSSSISEKG